jgi:hypothetical protein
MLDLHLQKSRKILDNRTSYLRFALKGQRARASFIEVEISSQLRQKSQNLIQKLVKDSTNDQKVIVNNPDKVPTLTTQNTDVSAVQKQKTKQKSVVKVKSSWRNKAFTLLMSVSFALLVTLFGPVIYFRYFGHETVPVQTTDTGTPLGGEFAPPKVEEKKIAIPPQDENLPEGNWIIIHRIGVRTQILESENPEESLVKGVWRAPEFGLPGDPKQPMILAAHRFGYNWWWKGEYWKYHSFYLLPDLQPGDLVEVISDKRKYLYEIYSGEEGTEIADYNADLILYTCKFLTSDIRHFRYARLIDPSKYSDYKTQSPMTPSNL